MATAGWDVVLTICKESVFDAYDVWAGMELVLTVFDNDTLNDIREKLLKDMDLQGNAHVVRFHLQYGCYAAATRAHFRPGHPTVEEDVKGRPVIYAHLLMKSDHERSSGLVVSIHAKGEHQEQQCTHDSRSPSRSDINTSIVSKKDNTLKRKEIADTTRSTFDKNEEKDNLLQDLIHLRVGTQEWAEDDDDSVPYGVVVVAEVKKEKPGQKQQQYATFRSVDVWRLPNVDIGHIEDGVGIDIQDKSTKWTPDPYFQKSSVAQIQRKIWNIVHGPVDVEYYKDLPRPIDLSEEEDAAQLVLAPQIPTYAPYEDQPQRIERYKGKKHINTVIYFKNECSTTELGLLTNLQAELAADESYDDFLRFIIDDGNGDSDFIGLRKHLHGWFKRGFQVEIWVLPLLEHGSDMFCWTRNKDWTAGHWLHSPVAERYGRRELYIEVHIMSNDPQAGNCGDVVGGRVSKLNGKGGEEDADELPKKKKVKRESKGHDRRGSKRSS